MTTSLIKDGPLTAAEARRLFDYDPITGIVVVKVSAPKRRAGTILQGSQQRVMVNTHRYKLPRLIWLHYYGEWPELMVDHKNRDDGDNSIDNLRQATDGQNQHNRRVRSPHGFKGVSLSAVGCKQPYMAQIRVNKVRIHLGQFDTAEEAGAAYAQAALKYHGEFLSLETREYFPKPPVPSLGDLCGKYK